jgi:hypothetical protein
MYEDVGYSSVLCSKMCEDVGQSNAVCSKMCSTVCRNVFGKMTLNLT